MAGIVYLLSNPAMPRLVKIGETTRDDPQVRMGNLYSTGVPLPFDCELAIEVENETAVERALHQAFEPNRVNPRRELFKSILLRLQVFYECLERVAAIVLLLR